MAKRSDDRRTPQNQRPRELGRIEILGSGKADNTALLLAAMLVAAVVLAFGQTLGHGFINCDDDQYVTRSMVARGVNAEGVLWALSTTHGSMWAPVTYVSHMLDVEVYGLEPWGHHFTNLIVHSATSVILFLVLWRMTGSLWPSAFAAAIFAIHPLRAETVAWVAERKGLLGGFFFVATLGAYASFVRHPFSIVRYVMILVLLGLGLMAKPILVPLPALMLLLDYWPLGRLHLRWRLLWEKLPMFLMVGASAAAAPLTQGSAVQSLQQAPMELRLANAPVACVAYMRQFLWPSGMYVPYLYPDAGYPTWTVFASLSVIAIVSLGSLAMIRRWPWLFVGWFWYLGTLAPTIGLVPVGIQVRADRYTYVPQIGLGLIVAWAVVQAAKRYPRLRQWYALASTLALSILISITWQQTAYWRDSVSLWRHALACAPNNGVAQTSLGLALLAEHRTDEAIGALRRAVEMQPRAGLPRTGLGSALARQGQNDEAMKQYEVAIGIDPGDIAAHIGLGRLLAARGDTVKAADNYREVLAVEPAHAEANNLVGNILARSGQLNAAIRHYQTAIRTDPDYAEAYANLGMALAKEGSVAEAVRHWRNAVRMKPDSLEVANQLAWVLATSSNASVRSGTEAVELAETAVRLDGEQRADLLDTLAAAYAENGQFPAAIRTATKAYSLAMREDRRELADRIEARIRLYEASTAYRGAELSPPSLDKAYTPQ